MPFKNRNWNLFWIQIKQNFLGMTGILTFVGFGIALVSPKLKDPTAISLVLWSGIGLMVCCVIWVIYHSWPPKLPSLNEFHNKNIPLDVLNRINPVPFKIGAIGSSKSGKTTFYRRCNFSSPALSRTNDVSAIPLQLPENKGHVVVLDGDGKKHTQQFVIIENADLLLIFFDHNETDHRKEVIKKRLSEHEDFFEQVLFHLSQKNNIKYIHVIMNKHDLWLNSISKEKLKIWFDTQIEKLRNVGKYELTYSFEHSNNKPENIGDVIDVIFKSKGDFNEK